MQYFIMNSSEFFRHSEILFKVRAPPCRGPREVWQPNVQRHRARLPACIHWVAVKELKLSYLMDIW